MKSIVLIVGLVFSFASFADASQEYLTQKEIYKMCDDAYISSSIPNCVLRFRDLNIHRLALKGCDAAYTSSGIPDCLFNLRDMRFSPLAYKGCDAAYTNSDIPACLKEQAGMSEFV